MKSDSCLDCGSTGESCKPPSNSEIRLGAGREEECSLWEAESKVELICRDGKGDPDRESLDNAQRYKLNTLIELRNENTQAN